jgi:hypothetical protein
MTNECSVENWEYQQENIQEQCGGAQWYFWIFSGNCYYGHGIMTATYCVYLNAAPLSLGSPGTSPEYAYNITLELYTRSIPVSIAANLTDRSPYGDLRNGTATYGNAIVENDIAAVSPLQYENTVLMKTNRTVEVVNSTVYQSYSQALNNLYAVLGYYNGTGVDDGDMATIQQTISTYNLEEAKLASSQVQSDQDCWIGGNTVSEYICRPVGLFDYENITARIGRIRAQTGLESVSGSVVNLVDG